MSSNTTFYFDQFDETPDWIELYNNTSQSISLENYALSDKRNDLRKWIIPSLTIKATEFLFINASGRDIRISASSWETIINKGDVCKYFLGTKEPPSEWKEINFNDLGWNIGFTGIGYGDDDDQTKIDPVNSIYLRKSFRISDKNNISAVMFNIDYDDGFIAWINGYEITRENLGDKGEFIAYSRSADNGYEAQLYQGQKLKAYFLNNIDSILVDGNNILTVQVNNYGSNSSDLTAIPFLTVGYKSTDMENNVAVDIISLIPTLHTNFSIANGEESVYLSDNLGEIIDSTKSILLANDISYGRKPDGSSNWVMFNNPTPGKTNTGDGYLGQTENPILSFPSGFYNSSVVVKIDNPSDKRKTYYTLNCSEPDTNSKELTSSFTLNKTSVLKVKSFEKDFLPSQTITSTYFIGVNKEIPVISISTDSLNLWDYNTGIYVLGPNAENTNPYFNANFWQDWEKPATFEFWDTERSNTLNQDVNIKIYGAWSRAFAQKSLAVFTKGGNHFEYKLFPDLDIDDYESIVLRNSGNDWPSTMIRDGFMQNMAAKLNIDRLAYRPAVLYLNGKYWGIHNIREKINLSFISSHHDVDKNNIDLLEMNGTVIDGDNESYIQMIDFLNTHNLSIDANYKMIKNQIDIPSFIDYNLFQIYINNTDWPGNNNKYWRPKTVNGKWRWILFDTDFGFGLYDSYQNNTLSFALQSNGPDWPNPPWATLILRKLLENPEFKNEFINRFDDLCNTLFTPENVKNLIEEIKAGVRPEINSHISRWNKFSFNQWEGNIEWMNNFADLRLNYLKSYFSKQFGLDGMRVVVINVSDSNAGKIHFNSLDIAKFPYYGNYSAGTKIKAKAIPYPGFIFTGWSGSVNSQSDSISIDLESSTYLTANFQKKSDFETIVINEINYNSNISFDTEDWLELYNNSNKSIDLSNWIFCDGNDSNKFVFPNNTIIQPFDFLVISRDTTAFKLLVKGAKNLLGNFDFGLNNNGDLLKLFNNNDEVIDTVRYDDVSPWVTEPDGSGNTLELKNPNLNNAAYSNWSNSISFGSPGRQNSNFIVSVSNTSNSIPADFNLYQNYPNPFNPSTKIRFSIPEKLKVTLEIFNVIGEKVDVLVNSTLDAGFHEIEFINSNLASGIYIYRLKTGNFMEAKKMVLLK